jgi:photosystem II stability/assembly factor-like uncharacterized protein
MAHMVQWSLLRALVALTLPALVPAADKPGPAPRFDPWTIIGPGGGGTMISPTISPHNEAIVVEHCDMTGAYITLDGAQSWRMFNLRGVVNTFAFDPRNPRVIYAGNEALWRSADTGRTWSMVFPDPKKNTSEHQNGDHAEYSLTTGDTSFPAGHAISGIVVQASGNRSATMADQIWLVFGARRGAGASLLYVSSDRGVTWSKAREFPGERILAMEAEPDALLVIGAKQVYRLKDGGWTAVAAVPAGITRASVGHADGRTFVYATSQRGEIHVSEDGGSAWHVPRTAPARFQAIATSAGNGLVAYAGFEGMKQGEGPENLFNGISKTTDGGRTWNIVHQESNRPSKNLQPSWIESRAQEGGQDVFFDTPWSLGVAPSNPNICYATDLFRTYRTLDGGKTWETVTSVRVGDNAWTTRGLDVTTNYGVHFDPFDSRHVIIDYTDIGAFQSHDGGTSWSSATRGVPMNWRNTTYWVVFDPQVKGRLWGAFSGVHDLPRPKMWRNRDPKTFVGGVGISDDGGNTWRPSSQGMPQTAVTHILLDVSSSAGARTLYASAYGRGVYKSTDDGKTWTLKNNGIEGEAPFAWRITQAEDRTLYLIVARRSEGNAGGSGDGALYRSRDGAEHWEKVGLPDAVNGPVGLTLDPRDHRRMYLAAWGQGRPDVDVGGGVFLTTDGGGTWKAVFQQSQHVYDVTVDPKDPKVIYACGFGAAAWRSGDGGATWQRIRGYTFKWGHRVVLDPVNPRMIYITTYGGSVWHGPAQPDPAVPEDIPNPIPVSR